MGNMIWPTCLHITASVDVSQQMLVMHCMHQYSWQFWHANDAITLQMLTWLSSWHWRCAVNWLFLSLIHGIKTALKPIVSLNYWLKPNSSSFCHSTSCVTVGVIHFCTTDMLYQGWGRRLWCTVCTEICSQVHMNNWLYVQWLWVSSETSLLILF